MHFILGALILAAAGQAVSDQRQLDAVDIFHCDFESPWDVNYDAWPDEWTRKTGMDFPHYLKIDIEDDPAGELGRSLRINLDGGAASVYSPPIPVDSRYGYLLEGVLKTKGLVNDRAFVTVTFYAKDNAPLETFYSDKVVQADRWTPLVFHQSLAPSDKRVERAVIGLHVHPTDHQDLRGWAMFDELRLKRLQRVSLNTSRHSNVYTSPQDVEIFCDLSGITEANPQVHFELYDVAGRKIAETTRRLVAQEISDPTNPNPMAAARDGESPAGYAGRVVWRPAAEPGAKIDYGFYRVVATILSSSGRTHQREISLAVFRKTDKSDEGEFGWTLAQGDHPLSLDALTELLPNVGIHWLKFPLWYGSGDDSRGDALMRFAERMSAAQIEMVGMLDKPPPEAAAAFEDVGSFSAANIFSADEGLWLPSLDPVMTRLSLKIRWWQLGGDHDTSFVGYPKLPQKVREIRDRVFHFGQEVNLGLGWQWLSEMQPGGGAWQFVSRSSDPPLRGAEMAAYLEGTPKTTAKNWVLVEPLPRSEYSLEVRAQDLVDQMMTAKIHHADGVFLTTPFSTEDGVMNDDGTPGELLLPWRITSLMLGGSKYLGGIRMPHHSRNHIFVRGDQAVMVLWNDHPTQEVLYLGDDLLQYNIWGDVSVPRKDGDNQVIPVGPTPTILTGVNVAVAKWRMAVAFRTVQIPSVFGKPHRNELQLQSFFKQGVGGRATLTVPEGWRMSPQFIPLNMAAGEKAAKPFEITLQLDASTGNREVRIDFNLEVDKPYHFSVYRDLEVGLGDIGVEIATRLDESGSLIVEQRMINNSDEIVDFKCYLYAPNRKRQRTQVFRLGHGQDIKSYRLPDAQELLGQSLYLRAEEINGQRILNYRFTAEE